MGFGCVGAHEDAGTEDKGPPIHWYLYVEWDGRNMNVEGEARKTGEPAVRIHRGVVVQNGLAGAWNEPTKKS